MPPLLLRTRGADSRNKKQCHLAAQFRRIARHRGEKRTIIAVAHSILVATYYIVRDGVDYHDLGPAHVDRLAPAKAAHDLIKRLEELGLKVSVEPVAA